MDRRAFLGLLALGGAAGALGTILPRALASSSPFGLPPKPMPPEQIPEDFPHEIRSPLRVAQWYDYWPAVVLGNFRDYIQATYGVTIQIVQDVYTSNEELINWMLISKSYDVVFPTQNAIEWMRNFGLLRPFDGTLLPNLSNLFPEYRRPAWALDKKGNLYSAGYMAGTTGLLFRTDKTWTTADVEAIGWDMLWSGSLGGTSLNQKLMALASPRDLLGMGLKKVGYDTTGQALVSQGQWSLNSTDSTKVNAARDSLLGAKPLWYKIDSLNAGSYVANDVVYASEVYSTDAIYAIRPNSPTPAPIEYLLPKQGFARWLDSACIPTFSQNVYLAHLFIDYLLRGDVAATIADWTLGATPNAAAYDLLTTQSGWDPRLDPRIYPDAATLARAEYVRILPAIVEAAYDAAYNAVLFG